METEQRVGLAAMAVVFLAVLGWFSWGKDAMTIRSAKEVAASEMIDPSSAQFRNLRAAKYVDGVVCGEINSKNRFGAYVGFTEFVVSDGRLTLPPSAGADDFRRLAWATSIGFCD